MQDVARLANVSLSTVSYALSGERKVSDATKARIETAMAELGFRPNALARGLASRRSRTLALIFPAMRVQISGTVTEFVASAGRTAREHGYHLVLWPFGPDEAEEIGDLVRQGMADGVLLMEVCLKDARVDALAAAGVPFTMIGRTDALAGLTFVDVDFAQTVEDAVAYLVDLGHERIGFINHSAASREAGYGATIRADEGYTDAMVSRGLTPRSLFCDESPAAGRQAIGDLLAAEPHLTAVITMNELATFGATVELQSRGLRIPDDLSVLSVVTSPGVGAMTNPPLTTMHAPGTALGQMGVEALIALVEGAAPTTHPVLITCELEEGRSTGPAPVPPTA